MKKKELEQYAADNNIPLTDETRKILADAILLPTGKNIIESYNGKALMIAAPAGFMEADKHPEFAPCFQSTVMGTLPDFGDLVFYVCTSNVGTIKFFKKMVNTATIKHVYKECPFRKNKSCPRVFVPKEEKKEDN